MLSILAYTLLDMSKHSTYKNNMSHRKFSLLHRDKSRRHYMSNNKMNRDRNVENLRHDTD